MSIGRVPGNTGIQPSIVDAKGDLIVATAADSVSRLAVGTNDYVLTADSAQATGLKWAAVTAPTTTWTAYSPTTSNITVGNGSLTTEYFKQGSFVAVRFRFKLGSTSSISGSIYIDLPFAASDANRGCCAQATFFDDNTNGIYDAIAFIAGTTNVYIYACNASATYTTGTALSSTIPFTWATDDSITTQFVYEAA